MPKKPPTASCVEHGQPGPRRLNGPEAVVIIVIVSTASLVVAFGRLAMAEALQLIGGAGALAALVVSVGSGAAGVRRALRALSAPASGV